MNPLKPRGAPFPLEGGRAGDGGGEGSTSSSAHAEGAAAASDRSSEPRTRATPIPDPSPLQGEGSRTAARQGRRESEAGEHKTGQARRLRKEQTLAERILWTELRRLNQGWRRQAPIGRFIVDFVRHEVALVVEVDGHVHELGDRAERDQERTVWLEAQGYAVLRLAEADVRNRTDKALGRILSFPPRARPSAARRGEARSDTH